MNIFFQMIRCGFGSLLPYYLRLYFVIRLTNFLKALLNSNY